MLAATSQVCPKGLVAFETLKAVHSKIVGLPVKEKKFFKTREAVDYLFQDIHDAIVNKNYTVEDISEYFVSAGWLISQTSLKQFWRFFRVCMESYENSNISSAKKEQHQHSKVATKKGKNSSAVGAEVVTETTSDKSIKDTKILSAEHEHIAPVSYEESVQTERLQPQSSAHFDLPPDSEDL